MENKISIVLNNQEKQNIKQSITELKTKLPKMVNLSNEDRMELPKMGDKTVSFVLKALDYAKQNDSMVPAYLNLEEFEKDVHAVEELRQILNPLKQLVEQLDDTILMAGSEAYSQALVFYHSLKGAAKADLPGTKTIYNDLKSRFPGSKKR